MASASRAINGPMPVFIPERDPEFQATLDSIAAMLTHDPVSTDELVTEEVVSDWMDFSMATEADAPPVAIDRLQQIKVAQLVRAIIPADAVVKNHSHVGVEFLYVAEGHLCMSLAGSPATTIDLKKGDSCVVLPAQGHVAHAQTECVVLAFLVPPDPAYGPPE